VKARLCSADLSHELPLYLDALLLLYRVLLRLCREHPAQRDALSHMSAPPLAVELEQNVIPDSTSDHAPLGMDPEKHKRECDESG
jgi:hypothetical protein